MWCRRTILPRIHQRLVRSSSSCCNLQCSPSPSRCYSSKQGKRGKAAPLQERMMVDKLRIWAKGGDGGNGCWSIRRSRTDWRGKPDGGNGGKGGDVILECSAAVWDFSNLQYHLNAKKGGHGVSKKMAGSRGSDKVVQVPVGTVVHLVSGEAPSFLEKTSTAALQPWEIPDTCEVEQSESANHTIDGKKEAQSSQWGGKQSDNLPLQYERNDKGEVCTVQQMHDSTDSSKMELNKASLTLSEEDGDDIEDTSDYEGLSEMEPEEEIVQYSVAELTEAGQKLIVARGGESGLGNAHLGKTTNPLKQFQGKEKDANSEIMDDETQSSITAGLPGSETVLILELKSIADVGLVGMPNAGKSTLLGAISRAKPAVGHYAFTTLRPNIGKLNYKDFFSVSVADIPGIIKGAHENRGLGHAFLRHIERTKVLAYVVDLAAALDGRKGIPPWEQLRDLVLELEYHQEGLSDRPSVIVANKIDEEGAEDVYEELKRRVQGVPIFPVCAVLEEGVPELKDGLRSLMDGRETYRLKLDNIVID